MNAKLGKVGTTIGEDYYRKFTRIHAHIRSHLVDFCAILESAGSTSSEIGPSDWHSISAGDEKGARDTEKGLYEPMLVGVVYLVQGNKAISPTPIPSMVWLQPLNHCLMWLGKALDHISAIPMPNREFPTRAVPSLKAMSLFMRGIAQRENREGCIPCPCRIVQEGQLIDKTIKSRPHVIGKLPDRNTPISEIRNAVYLEAHRMLAGLRIEFCPDNTILCQPPQIIGPILQEVEYLSCTPNLEARAIKRVQEVATELPETLLIHPNGHK